ncbi:MAG TPA: threonine--tRNA ligase [Anaerolineae bacterium]|nr:threonine--tRNA ligase [Anaerolineae bacterium]
MIITYPDGSTIEFKKGSTFMNAALVIDEEFAKKVFAVKVNGKLFDLSSRIPGDVSVEFLTFNDEEGRKVYWHSTSHVMASAVKRLFPDAKMAIGPAIDEGFYYDFDVDNSFTQEDLENIESEMKAITIEGDTFVREELSKVDAIDLFTNAGETYKVELTRNIEDDIVTLYKLGEFVDLCRGPHVPSTSGIKAFKLLSTSGAYWRGDEHNRMLQRIYGISFPNNKMLKTHLKWREEVRKRDHRVLGTKLDLFSIDEEIGSGLILWHQKGALIREIIENYWRDEHRKRGYELVFTPHIASEHIYHRSGHLENYAEYMYSPMDIDGTPYYVKPMNCPGHIKIFQSRIRSYRELPVRLCELGTVYRYERSGVLHGMMRVRGFTQDDSHIFCTPEQVIEEVISVLDFIRDIMKVFGYEYEAYLSTKPEKSLGDEASWEHATTALRTALERTGTSYEVDPGEGVFYGPKIDIKLKDALGRLWQGPTIQVDFNQSERFNINYIGKDGREHKVVMIHRVVLGSMERFIGTLIEHYGGSFPVWLSPVQVIVMPITDAQHNDARMLFERMKRESLRVEFDSRNEKINRKIRDAEEMKIPYMIIVGKKEVDAGNVSVRKRGKGDIGILSSDEIISRIITENDEKSRD